MLDAVRLRCQLVRASRKLKEQVLHFVYLIRAEVIAQI